MGYQFYIQDTAELLKDQSFMFTSQAQLTRWVNAARKQIAKRTGCIQRLITGQSAYGAGAQPGFITVGGAQPGALPTSVPSTSNPQSALNTTQGSFMTVPGVERYPYKGFFNPVLQGQFAGVDKVLDVIQISVSWGGVSRPALDWLPFDEFQAYCRGYANQVTNYPYVWSVDNDGTEGSVWLFPTPSQANELEALVTCTPIDIFSDNDYDAIPEEYQDLIKWRTAYYAFWAAQRYAQAEEMNQIYMSHLGVDQVSRDRGKLTSYYPDMR